MTMVAITVRRARRGPRLPATHPRDRREFSQALPQFLWRELVADALQLAPQVVRERHSSRDCARLEPAVQSVGDMPDLNHACHAENTLACGSHVRRRPHAERWAAESTPSCQPPAPRRPGSAATVTTPRPARYTNSLPPC